MIPLRTRTRLAAPRWSRSSASSSTSASTSSCSRASDRRDDVDHASAFEHAAIPCEVVDGRPLTVDELRATYDFGDDDRVRRGLSLEPRRCSPTRTCWLAVLYSMFLHGEPAAPRRQHAVPLGLRQQHRGPPRARAPTCSSTWRPGWWPRSPTSPSSPTAPSRVVGASGAIAGVMGAYLVWFPNVPILTAFFFVIILSGRSRPSGCSASGSCSQFFINPNAGVAWVAHVGGFVFGVLVGARPAGRRRTRCDPAVADVREPLPLSELGGRPGRPGRRPRRPGRGSTGRSSAAGDPGEHEGEAGAERAGRSAPSVDGPVADHGVGTVADAGPGQGGHRRVGLAGDHRRRRRRPSATAARIAPPPGIGPVGRRVGGVVVRADQAGAARTRRGRPGSALVVEGAGEADDHGVGGAVVDHRRRPGPRAPRRRRGRRTPGRVVPGSSSEAAACGRGEDVARRRGCRRPASLASWSPRRTDELLVTNRTRSPAARSRATASAAPGGRSSASQITPSRSRSHVTAAQLSPTRSGLQNAALRAARSAGRERLLALAPARTPPAWRRGRWPPSCSPATC